MSVSRTQNHATKAAARAAAATAAANAGTKGHSYVVSRIAQVYPPMAK